MINRLMVIVPDRISDFLGKGEITERYYNPGDLFDEVHIVMTNDDRPDVATLQKTIGSAKLHLYNIPATKALFALTLGWRPWLLGCWTRKLVKLAKTIRPSLIRCHGAHLNTFAASRIKAELGIPYVVSLHINPDEDVRGRSDSLLKRTVTHMQQTIERAGLLGADLVMPVYRPIVPYLERLGVTRYEVCYNVLNPSYLHGKQDYQLHKPVRIISVGRQFREKNPEHLMRAVADLPDTHLTLVGDGPYHAYLRGKAKQFGMEKQIEFIPSIANDELCRRLPDYDIFAVHTEYWEISKAVLETLLTGLPMIINRRHGDPVPELTDDICLLVDNTSESYGAALEKMMTDHAFRERLGRSAYAHAQAHWEPEKTEAKYTEIYRKLAKLGKK